MILKLKSPNVVLKTKDKYCTEDIHIEVDESVTNGQVNNLKRVLDATKSAQYLFDKYQGESVEGLISYSDTENVENFSYMFYNCSSLTTIPQLDTSNGTEFSSMFSGCSELTEIPPLDTSKGTNFNNMFNNCPNLITVPPLDTSKGTNISYIFYSCNKILKIDITRFYSTSTSNSNSMFRNCYSLKAFIIRSFGENYVLNSNAFGSAYHMLGGYQSSYNPEGLQDGYVYIPRAYMDIIPNETNWSTLQFRALEDYTVDGTTTGEFDDAKAGLV